jgi:glycosyltransferase involved in cell wall biosynthesis
MIRDRVSVLVPNFNGAPYLQRCLDSILHQTFAEWHAVVGDNNSSDESPAMVLAIEDPRMQLVRRPRTIGWVSNVNLLLAEARGDYVAILHADDWWEPEFLSTMVALLDRFPEALIASCATHLIQQGHPPRLSIVQQQGPPSDSYRLTSPEALRLELYSNAFYAPSVLARSRLYEIFPRFEETLPLEGDWLMWLRAASAGEIAICSKPLANYLIHDSSMGAGAYRSNLWAADIIKMHAIIRQEWADKEPFPGAKDRLSVAMARELVGFAYRSTQRGDTGGAILQARLARAIAPSWREGGIGLAAELYAQIFSRRAARWAATPLKGLTRRLAQYLVRPTDKNQARAADLTPEN